MHLDLTLRLDRRDADGVAAPDDVDLTAADTTTVAELLRWADADDRTLVAAGRRLDRAQTLAEAGVRSGALLQVVSPGTAPAHAPDAGAVLAVVGGPEAGRAIGLAGGPLHVGRAADCDLPLAADADVSRSHAVVTVGPHGVTAADLGSTNGTTLDGEPVGDAPVAVAHGAVVRLGDSFLAVLGAGRTPAVVHPLAHGLAVNRPPRVSAADAAGTVAWPSAPARGTPHRVQLVAALVPAVAGVGFAWYLHAAQFLCFALLSPIVLLATAASDRWHGRRSYRRALREHRIAVRDAQRAVGAALAAETAARRRAHPDPVTLAAVAELPGTRLWERRRDDPDAVSVRLGLGDVTSATSITVGTGTRPAGRCRAVPLTVSLRPGAVGVAGPRSARDAVGRWLLAQLAALHSPVDLELAVLTADDGSWRWCRWLPHLRGRVASATDEWPAVVRDLLAVVDRRTAARRSASSAATSWPWLVVLIDPGDVRADVPGLAELVARGPAVGVTAVWLAPRAGALPSGCRAVVDIGGATGSTFVLMSDERHEGVLDQVSAAWADRVARALAPLIDADGDPSATLPPTCSLVDVHDGLLDPDVVVARWAAAGDGARTTVGRGADGDLVLDLAADGPHALVAGTTGAGKSELLQTLVVGLALEHPPEDLALLLVDYKGGAAFAECAGLPHTVGVVTDLDPHLTRRALRSLDAELLRREQRFAAAGAPDLTTYRARAGVPPVPRLVIVVDEFASLAGELPEFIPGLVGIARRGRSLGVHLVLATQRPGTAVSPEIRANTALRIALRVTDPNESTDVLDDPAAAGIDRRLPGRAVVRLGASLTHVQVAHASGVARADDAAVRCLGPWRSRPQAVTGGETDLARLVGAVRTAADRHGRHGHPGPWLPALPDRLALADLPATDDPLRVPFGLVDRPDVQRQDALVLDLARAGGWLVSGGARSGRSTACLTAVLAAADRVGPDRLQVAVVDPAARLGPLAALPHVSTACIGHGGDALRLLDRLAADLERRRRHLAGRGRSSFAEAGHGLPAQLVVVDGWEALTALSDELDGGRAAETLLAIARTGAAAGVTVLLTGDRTTLSPRVAGVFAHRMLLTPNDRGDFGLAGIGPKAVPAQLPPGRGLLVPEAAEVQLAVIADGPGATADLARRVAAIAARPAPRPAWPPVRIVPLPERVHVGDIDAAGDGLLLGVGGDTAEVVRWRPATHDALLVAGPPRSGRSTLLRLLLHQAHDRDLKPVVVAPARSPLAGSARRLGVEVLRPDGDPPPHLLDVVDPTLVLIDDVESLDDTRLGDHLHRLLRDDDAPALVVAAGRTDDIATSYRGLVAELRRRRCGVLLQPGPADGDLLGVRGPRRPSAAPPGRGIVVGDRTWDGAFAGGEPVPLQVALVGDDPGDAAERVTPC